MITWTRLGNTMNSSIAVFFYGVEGLQTNTEIRSDLAHRGGKNLDRSFQKMV